MTLVASLAYGRMWRGGGASIFLLISSTMRKLSAAIPLIQCAVERRLLLAGANPAQQLSLRLVAARADHGGNNMV